MEMTLKFWLQELPRFYSFKAQDLFSLTMIDTGRETNEILIVLYVFGWEGFDASEPVDQFFLPYQHEDLISRLEEEVDNPMETVGRVK